MSRRGSVLVGVLWCLALLSLVVVGGLHSVRMNLQVTRHQGDRIQAHYLALAGMETAKALLFEDARARSRSRQVYHDGLADDPARFRDVPLGRGRFRVIQGTDPEEAPRLRFGVRNEDGRLNLNTATAAELARLRGMTPGLVAAILDWRDSDHQASAGGAEQDYYLGLQPPGWIRNGPFPSVRELLAVRGVTREALFGEDRRANGLPAAENGDDGEDSGLEAGWGPGWAPRLTVHSATRNLNEAGEPRVSLQTAQESDLAAVPGVSGELARAIVAHRGQTRFQTIADLLEVRAVAPGRGSAPGAPGSASPAVEIRPPDVPSTPTAPPAAPAAPAGPPLVSESLLFEIAGDLTATEEESLPGLVNVNTAGVEVLALLPGMTRELAHAVVAHRDSQGAFPNEATLLRVPGLTRDVFRELAARVTVRAETFRILSEGFIPSTGVRRRLETVVRVGVDDVQTLAYREDGL